VNTAADESDLEPFIIDCDFYRQGPPGEPNHLWVGGYNLFINLVYLFIFLTSGSGLETVILYDYLGQQAQGTIQDKHPGKNIRKVTEKSKFHAV
jgi:hypothetical protein